MTKKKKHPDKPGPRLLAFDKLRLAYSEKLITTGVKVGTALRQACTIYSKGLDKAPDGEDNLNYHINRLRKARNARTHSRHQLRCIARSIEKLGFLNPVLVDKNGRIIAGHGRVEAGKLLGLTTVPVIRIGR
jgi:hypothetical protein